MSTPIIPISYNDYFSDDDSDEPVVSYNDTVRPSELIRSSKHCNSSDTDSSDDNLILASIEEQREREKKKDFRLGKHVLLPSSRQSGEDFVDRIRREGGLWRHVFQVWYRNVRGDDHEGGRLRQISGREKSWLSDGKKSWRQKVIERRRKRKRHASTL